MQTRLASDWLPSSCVFPPSAGICHGFSLSYLCSTRKTTLSAVSTQVTDSDLDCLESREIRKSNLLPLFPFRTEIDGSKSPFSQENDESEKTKIFKTIFFRFILCVWELCVNVRYVCALHAGLVPEVRKGIRSTGPGVRDDCGLPCGCWVSNLVLCKSNTFFSRLSICPAHWEANLNSFSHFCALLAQQLILVRKVFKVFSLSKAPFFFLLNSRVNTYAWKARGCNL